MIALRKKFEQISKIFDFTMFSNKAVHPEIARKPPEQAAICLESSLTGFGLSDTSVL
jgi:hypothetical protein